jgi:2'-5' RNA ligase
MSLELVPDDDGRAAVRALWEALREVGLPSQADHAAESNEVHLTVAEAEELDPDDERVAEVGSLLPVVATVAGLVVLGSPRSAAVALLVVPPTEVVAAVARLPRRDARPWVPHVTLARRLDRRDAGDAVATVRELPEELRFTGLRHWDPAARTITSLVTAE